jgi:tRNA A37 threonylcarbamoyladenosine synthetase subunit TsaC/SUA5/YrdC
LCRACDRPLTATSANPSGSAAAEEAEAVAVAFADVEAQIAVLLDAGRTPGGPPSTIVDVSSAVPRLVRAGAIAWETIQRCLTP